MPLCHRAHLREVGAARALERVDLDLKAAHVDARLVKQAFALGTRLAQDQLRLAVGLLPGFGAQLLRGNERVVERLVALAERAELLVESLRLGLELR